MKKPKLLIPLLALTLLCFIRPGSDEITLMFTGDIIMHTPVKVAAEARNITDDNNKSLNNRGYDYPFERIKPLLSQGDIVCGNMEFPISPPYFSKAFIFNCRPDVLSAMIRSGFNVMTVANNHLLDQGGEGVINTINYLNEYEMPFIGTGFTEEESRAGLVKEVDGFKVGLLGYSDLMNYPVPRNPKGYYINMFDDTEKVIADIDSMKERVDFVVLVVHAGVEYALTPEDELREKMITLAESGADLIIAHHPHIIQPFEKIGTEDDRQVYIFYSLGNFISNQSSTWATGRENERLSTRDSAVVKVRITRGGFFRNQRISFELFPIMTLNDFDSEGKRRIQTVKMSEEIDFLKAEALLSEKDSEIQRLKARIEEIKKRLEAVRYSFFRYVDEDENVIFVK